MHDRIGLNVHRDAWPTAAALAAQRGAGFAWVQVQTPPRAMLAERRHALRHARALRGELDGSGLRLVLHAPDDLSGGTLEQDRALDGLLDYAAGAGAELVAYHGLNFAAAEGPAGARLRERAQLEERSLIPRLQRAHSLGITPRSRISRPCSPDSGAAATTRSSSATSSAGWTRPRPGCCSTSATCISPPTRRAATSLRCSRRARPTSCCSTRTTTSAVAGWSTRPGSTRSSSTFTCPPGRGTLPWERVAAVVGPHAAPVMLEVERSHRPALDVLARESVRLLGGAPLAAAA